MDSVILEKLSDREKVVLAAYREPSARDLRRVIRLSLQYAIGAGVFLALAIAFEEPLYAVGVYAVLVAVMLVRILAARAIAGIIPGIIDKYEAEITRLREESS